MRVRLLSLLQLFLSVVTESEWADGGADNNDNNNNNSNSNGVDSCDDAADNDEDHSIETKKDTIGSVCSKG